MMKLFAVLFLASGGASNALANGAPVDKAFHWQQGQWFEYPLAYRNPMPNAADVPLIQSRAVLERNLARAVAHTGYVENGRYDPDAITEPEATMWFAFHMDGLRPVERDLRFDPDLESDDPVIVAELVWVGATPPPSDATRAFDVLLARIGPPTAPGTGYLSSFHDSQLSDDRATSDYRIYEAIGERSAVFRCNIRDEERGGVVLQPICDGHVWDRATDTILYLKFPAEVASTGAGWSEAADAALQLVRSWHVDD